MPEKFIYPECRNTQSLSCRFAVLSKGVLKCTILRETYPERCPFYKEKENKKK